MLIDTNQILSITETNQNFSKAKLMEKQNLVFAEFDHFANSSNALRCFFNSLLATMSVF